MLLQALDRIPRHPLVQHPGVFLSKSLASAVSNESLKLVRMVRNFFECVACVTFRTKNTRLSFHPRPPKKKQDDFKSYFVHLLFAVTAVQNQYKRQSLLELLTCCAKVAEKLQCKLLSEAHLQELEFEIRRLDRSLDCLRHLKDMKGEKVGVFL